MLVAIILHPLQISIDSLSIHDQRGGRVVIGQLDPTHQESLSWVQKVKQNNQFISSFSPL
jgi:hypothetical protein